jgi:hypothetical protein
MQGLVEIAIGVGMVVLTTIVHAVFMVSGNRVLEWHHARFGRVRTNFSKAVLVSGLTAWQFVAVVSEGFLWAVLYMYHPMIRELPDLETALYFSMTTFTTVGYGDITLDGNWRMLASLQGANGVIIFGWTTALIFHYIQNIYARQ